MGFWPCALAVVTATVAFGSPEQELIDWVISRGGQVDLEIGRECPTCLRGALAGKDFSEGDIIARVPVNSSVRFQKTQAYAPEYAYEFLSRMHLEPEFNSTFGPVLAAMAPPEDVFTPEMFSDSHIKLLQSPELERLIRSIRDNVEQVYHGRFAGYQPLSEVVGKDRVSLQQFAHMSASLASHLFEFYMGSQMLNPFLVPILDACNHAEDPNTHREENGTEFFQLRALKPILKGQALTQSYQQNIIHRSDMKMIHYGFVEKEEKPLLCAVDLPTYTSADPWQETPPTDAGHEPWVGKYATASERARLTVLLAAMPTTEAEDEALLAGGGLRDWRERTLVQFRVQRKKALRLVLEKLGPALGRVEL